MWNCWPQIKKEFSIWIKFWIKILNYVLDILTPHFIQASCKKHDYWYQVWWDEKRRLECDLKFHYYICKDIEELKCNIFKKIWLYILSSIFFLAVRIGWKKSFNYKK